VTQNAKGRQKPYDHANHHNNIEDLLDLPVHGNVVVDEPEQYANYDESYYERDHLLPFMGRILLRRMNIDTAAPELTLWGDDPISFPAQDYEIMEYACFR